MTKTITIKGWIQTRIPSWTDEREFAFASFEDWTTCGYTMVAPHSFEYTLPDDFNPTQVELASLEKQKADVIKAFTTRLAQLNERIANLQAITYVGAAE